MQRIMSAEKDRFILCFLFADIERQDRYAVLAAISGILVTLLWRASPPR